MKKKHNKDDELEDWHKPEYKEDPDNAPKTFMKPPKKYEANFLAKMDRRTEAFQLLNDAYQEIMSDMGGTEGLSHVQICLAERFTFLEFVLCGIEQRIATEPKKSAKLLSRWIQGLNSIVGLAKTIGLERRAKKIVDLKTYISKEHKRKERSR